MKKIILDLCGETGSWSAPYKEAGYDVYNITLPDYRVENCVSLRKWGGKNCLGWGNTIIPIRDIFGVFAAPPCTHFSFARTNAKKPRNFDKAMTTVYECLRIIWECQKDIQSDQQKYSPIKFWALENPYYGMLRWFLGKPAFVFDPWEFGDAYKKKTALWGHFNEPIKTHKNIEEILTKEQIEKHKTNSQALPKFDYMASKDIHPEYFGKFDRQTRRAIMSKGFAYAFYKANK